jgi:RNA polymerase sigma factor (sigma-70 family)
MTIEGMIAPPKERTPQQCRELAAAGLRYALKAVALFHKHRPDLFRLMGADDARGTALLSIVRASHYFEPGRGAKFSTYATRAALMDLMRAARQVSLIRVPGNVRGENRVAALERVRVVSFDRMCRGRDDLPFDPMDPQADPVSRLADAECRGKEIKALYNALALLPERLRLIVVQYHLLDRSLGEIGGELGLCIERVRVLRGQGEARLRQMLGAEVQGPLPGQRGRHRARTQRDSSEKDYGIHTPGDEGLFRFLAGGCTDTRRSPRWPVAPACTARDVQSESKRFRRE